MALTHSSARKTDMKRQKGRPVETWTGSHSGFWGGLWPPLNGSNCRGGGDSGSAVFARRSNQRPAVEFLAAGRQLRWMSRPLCWTHTLNTGTFLSANSAWVNDLLRHWVLTALSLLGVSRCVKLLKSLSWRFVWDFFFFNAVSSRVVKN